MGNGVANIIAALIIAGALVGTEVLDRNEKPQSSALPSSQDEVDQWIARAVGDIRNDIVVNCGCCGEGEGAGRQALRTPTRSF